MKRLMVCILALALALGLTACGSDSGRKPYRDLTGDDIASATVQLIPPDTTLLVEDTDALAALLRDVVIYDEDASYTEYAGQAVIFTLTMADGSQTTIMAYNPFLVIDGVGYQTKYAPCEALNAYANRLLNNETVTTIIED